MQSLTTPVVLFIYRRPATTKQVFNQIRTAQPTQLFIVADGWKSEDEKKLCEAARAVTEMIDWPCEVQRQYAAANMGDRLRIPSGLDWVFQQVDRAIIIEDDTVPDQSFFYFCQEMLNHYKNNERVMHITGVNLQHNNKAFYCPTSYYFSNIPVVNSWATWRRAWQQYDPDMEAWGGLETRRYIFELLGQAPAALLVDSMLTEAYEQLHAQQQSSGVSWDRQWWLTCALHQGACVTPRVNLIRNIGYGPGATRTTEAHNGLLENLPTAPITFPLVHPTSLSIMTRAAFHILRCNWKLYSTIRQRFDHRLRKWRYLTRKVFMV